MTEFEKKPFLQVPYGKNIEPFYQPDQQEIQRKRKLPGKKAIAAHLLLVIAYSILSFAVIMLQKGGNPSLKCECHLAGPRMV